MASKIKAVAEVELKVDRFTNPAKQAKSTITQLGKEGKQSLDKISQSAKTTSQSVTKLGRDGQQSLDKISQSARTAKQSVSQLGTSGQQSMGALGASGSRAGGQITSGMNQATQATRQLNLATQQATVSNGTLILGIAALGTSVGTTFTGMSALNKAHIKQDKANLKVEKSTIGVARAQDLLTATLLAVKTNALAVTKLEEAGQQGTEAWSIAVEKLTLQQQKLTTAEADLVVKTKDIAIAQASAAQVGEDLSDTYINMTISLANTGLMSAFLAKTMLPNLTRASIVNKFAIIANSRAFTSMIFSMKKFRIATTITKTSMIGMAGTTNGLTFSLKGLKIGIRGVFLAMGPIGFAILAIGIGMEIWMTNAFGVQEAIFGLWEQLKKLLPILQIIESAVKSIFPETQTDAEEFTDSIDSATESASELKTELGDLSKLTQDQFTPSIVTATDDINDFAKATKSATNESKAFGKELDVVKKKQKLFSDSVATSPEIIGFRSGEGSSVTVGGQTFRSRITPQPSRTIGGDAANAIRQAGINQRNEQNRIIGVPQGTLLRINQSDAFANSARGFLASIFKINNLPSSRGRSASKSLDRVYGSTQNVINAVRTIQTAIKRGFATNSVIANIIGTPENPTDERRISSLLRSAANELTLIMAIEDARIAQEQQTQRISDFSRLSSLLGLSESKINFFTFNEQTLSNFVTPLVARSGFSRHQVQNFITTKAGRANIANKILFEQRESLRRMTV